MNYIDKLFMNPIFDKNGRKISIIETDKRFIENFNTLRRTSFILGEPINYINNYYTIKKKKYIRQINSCPYI